MASHGCQSSPRSTFSVTQLSMKASTNFCIHAHHFAFLSQKSVGTSRLGRWGAIVRGGLIVPVAQPLSVNHRMLNMTASVIKFFQLTLCRNGIVTLLGCTTALIRLVTRNKGLNYAPYDCG